MAPDDDEEHARPHQYGTMPLATEEAAPRSRRPLAVAAFAALALGAAWRLGGEYKGGGRAEGATRDRLLGVRAQRLLGALALRELKQRATLEACS